MVNLCNVDGELVAEADARIPVLDRGFLFGDSIYEVLRTRGGHLFAWREHLRRLAGSAAGIGMELDLDERAVLRRTIATLRAAGNPDSYVRIIVTRGTGSAPSIDLAAAPGPLRWIVLVRPLPAVAATATLRIVDRLRNDRRALDPATKSGNYLNNVLGLAEAKRLGASDAVFLNAAGHVTEASTANVFARRGDGWVTPPLGAGLLAGITRALVVEFLRGRGETVVEADLTAADLRRSGEVFLTSTLRDIAPVTHLDGQALAADAGDSRCQRLAAAFAALADQRARDLDGPAALRVVAE